MPRYGECWLKHQRVMPPPEQQQAPQGGGNPWTSGLLYTGDGWLAPWQQRSTLTLHFALGDVAVQLLPELAPVSVRELRRLAALIQPSGGYCRGCRCARRAQPSPAGRRACWGLLWLAACAHEEHAAVVQVVLCQSVPPLLAGAAVHM